MLLVAVGVLGWLAAFAVLLVLVRRALLFAAQPSWTVALAFAVTAQAVIPSVFGRLTHDLVRACGLTAVLAGLALFLLDRRFGRPPAAPPALSIVRLRRPYLLLAGLAFALVAATALRGHYFDEDWMHYQITGVLARGVVPPEHPLFPGRHFAYHYGFNVLAAEIAAFTRIDLEHAIDVVKIPAFLLLLASAAAAGNRLGGALAASLAMVLVPLGSSPLYASLFRGLGELEPHLQLSWLPGGWAGQQVPPVIINFFQHPQGLGMPLALAALPLLFPAEGSERQRDLSRALGALYLGALSLMHIVFFAVLGVAVGGALVAGVLRRRDSRTVAEAFTTGGLLVGSLLLARALGGFFGGAPIPGGAGDANAIVFGKSYFGEPFWTSLAHHLAVFGLPLLALPIAIAHAVKRADPVRIALAIAAVVGFTVPNVMVYARSFDVVKFYTIGAFFLNLQFADLLGALWQRGKRFGAVVAALVLVTTATSWLWLARTTVLDGRAGIHRWEEPVPLPISKAFLRVTRDTVGPYDRLLSTNIDLSKAGFLTPGFNYREVGAEAYLLDFREADHLLAHRNAARHTLAREHLDALGVSFLALSPGDVDSLTPDARAALADPARFVHVLDVEADGQTKKLYRVVR